MKRPTDTRQLISEDPTSALSTGALWKIKDPSLVLEQLELQLEAAENDRDGGMGVLMTILSNEIHQQRLQDLIKHSFLGSFQAAKLQFIGQKKATDTSECKEGGSPPYETKRPTRKCTLSNPGLFKHGEKERKLIVEVALGALGSKLIAFDS